MERQTLLRLVSQARLLKRKNRTGVCVKSKEIWAKNSFQELLLQEIAMRPQSVAELNDRLKNMQGGPETTAACALNIADFILTFGEAIEEERGKL